MPDLATDVFSDVAEAVANLNGARSADVTGGDTSDSSGEVQETSDTQDVDSQSQGDVKPPATSGEKAEEETETKDSDAKPQPEGRKKVDGAAQVRQWGEKWEKTAKEHEAKLKEFEPVLKMVDEKFGGTENLNLAAEIYGAITAEEFDPEDAIEFLSENVPEVATSLVNHIAKSVISRATETALERTFGRKLSDEEISEVTNYLASGKKTGINFDSFFKNGEDLPDELLVDADGNRLPDATVDYLRRQNSLLRQSEERLRNVESRITTADEQARNSAAANAIEEYVTNQFSIIDKTIQDLGLHQGYEGETEELKGKREKYAGMLEGVAMWLASKDEGFQSMYQEALKNVAKDAAARATSPSGNRVAKSRATDYSRRLQAKISDFADEARELISPLLETITATRKSQVANTKTAKGDVDAPASDKLRKQSTSDDPFDRDEIQAAARDIRRTVTGR